LELYKSIDAPMYTVSLEEAELLKLASNAFYALKTGFANEMGRLCERLSLDSHTVMGLLCADTKNISPAYLRPGFAFGGSCLPKDLRSLIFHARRLGAKVPILESIIVSNWLQVETVRLKVVALNVQRVTVLGVAFKANTDDLRESPVIDLIKRLLRDGMDITVYDPDVSLDDMLGRNREFIEQELPQIRRILCPTIEKALHGRQAVIVSQERPEFNAVVQELSIRVAVLDLVQLHSLLTPRGET
jgi:GDP-mannose 6-dehydrogenase